MTAESNLSFLQEAQASLTDEQKQKCDMLLIGVLSVYTPTKLWRDCVRHAAELAMKQTPQGTSAAMDWIRRGFTFPGSNKGGAR